VSEMTEPQEPVEVPTDDLTRELQDLQDRLDKLRADNQRKATALQNSGAALNPSGVLMLRVSSILGVLPPEWQLQANVAFEFAISEQLDVAAAEVRKARLTSGILGPDGTPHRG